MKVILKSDITGLGEEGSIVDVSPGYARNFLFPNKRAIQHNAQNKSVLNSRMKAIEQRRGEKRKMHASVKERLESETITVAMTSGEKGHLYGAVTAQIISELLEKKGISIPKSHIILPDGHSIKNIGVYSITVKLYHGVQAECKVVVTDQHGNSAQETPTQEKKQLSAAEAQVSAEKSEATVPAEVESANIEAVDEDSTSVEIVDEANAIE